MKQNTTDIAGHHIFRALRLPFFAACALLALAPAARAQTTLIDSSTSIPVASLSLAASSIAGYQVAGNVVFTITPAGASSSNGGAFNVNAADAFLQIGPSTVDGNGWTVFNGFAGSQGGAINAQTGTVSLTNVTFDGCSATNNGGAIRESIGVVFITNGTFINNYAAGANGGGAIQNTGAQSKLELSNVFFGNNRAAYTGGAFNAMVNSVSMLTDVVFQNNWAGATGGAYFCQPGAQPTTIRLTGTNGISDYRYTGNFAGGSAAAAITAADLTNGIAPFAPSAAAGGFLYINSAGIVTFDIASGVTLTIGDANATNRAYDTIASTVTNARWAKDGDGTMTLNADNSYYSGTVTINKGKLLLGNAEARLSGVILVNNGGILGGVGTIMSSTSSAPVSLTANAGSIIDIGLSSAMSGTLTVDGALALNAATLNFDLFGLVGGNYVSDKLLVTGALTAVTSTISINSFATGTYNLGNLGAIKSNLAPIIASGATRQTVTLDVSGVDLLLIASADQSRLLTWTGAADNVFGANLGSWSNLDGINEFASGDQLVFDGNASVGDRSLVIPVSGVTVSEMTVSDDGYVFGGAGGIISGTRFIQPAAIPAETVAATGKLIKTGNGTLTFSNSAANTFENGIKLDGGIIAFNRGDQLDTTDADGVNRGIEFTGSGTLRATANITSGFTTNSIIGAGNTAGFDTNGFNVNYTGTISLAGPGGTLAKFGAGTLTFNAGSTTGLSTQVAAGALMLAGGTLGGTVNVNSGATFGGSGVMTGAVTVAANATLDIGASSATADTLTVGDLSFTGATLKFDLFGLVGESYVSDQLIVTGNLDIASSGTISINLFRSGTYNLGNLGVIENNLVTVVAGGGARQTAGLIADGSNLLLVAGADQSRSLYWTGGAGMSLDVSAGSWTDGATINEFASGDRVIFDNTHDTTASRNITITNSAVMVSELVVSAGDYTFSGTGGITSGTRFIQPALEATDALVTTGKLIKNGAGALTFENTGSNNFEGGIDINAGVIAFSTAAQLGTKDNAGIDQGISFKDTGTLRANASVSLAGNIIIADAKTATLDTNGNTVDYSGVISLAGASGTLAKIGSGTLVYSAPGNVPAFAVDIREDTLVLNSSTLSGLVRVRSGATFAGAGAATGTGNNGVFLDAGSALRIQDSLNIANLVVQGNATLTGSGTLAGAGSVMSGATATVAVDAGNQMSITGSFGGGTGALAKSGPGALVLESNANLAVNSLALDEGLLLMRGVSVSAASGLAIAPGSELRGTGAINVASFVNGGIIRVGNAADPLAPHGTLDITGNNYTGNNGAVYLNAAIVGDTVACDQLLLHGMTISGTTTLFVNITSGTIPTSDQVKSIALLDAAGTTMSPGAFFGMDAANGIETSDDIYLYSYSLPEGWYRVGYISPLKAMLGMDAAAMLIDSAALDSASNHIMTLRGIEHQPRARVWFNTIYRNDKISSILYDGATAETRGAQVGLDWGNAASTADDSLAIGVFYDYATTSLDTPSRASATDTTANGLGAYFAYGHGRWHATGIYHRSFQKHSVNAPGSGSVDTKARAWSASFEGGYEILNLSKWKAELYGQYNYQSHNISECKDAEGIRLYQFKPVNSSVLRGGMRVWRDIELRSGAIIRPWLRGSYAREQNATTRMKVTTLKNDLRWDFENDMSGSGAAVDAGVSLELGNRLLLTAGGSWYSVGKVESYSLNFGTNIAW